MSCDTGGSGLEVCLLHFHCSTHLLTPVPLALYLIHMTATDIAACAKAMECVHWVIQLSKWELSFPNHNTCILTSFQQFKQDNSHIIVIHKLTLPPSHSPVTITMWSTLYCHTILQKSPTVDIFGPTDFKKCIIAANSHTGMRLCYLGMLCTH